MKREIPGAPDGEYALKLAPGPAMIYCAGMAGMPKEYLTLQNTGWTNYARYKAGGYVQGSDVTTYYTKLRINPITLLVDISDQTFASSTGQLTHPGGITVTSMPYGVAMSCDPHNAGVSYIDLRGTSFAVAPV